MSKKKEYQKNRLGINYYEANLKRHPSVKGLFDEDGNMKSPTDSKDELLLLNILSKSEKETDDTSYNNGDDEKEEKDKNTENNDKKPTMSVKINRVEEKIVDNKETFYVEMSDKEKEEFIKAKMEKKKPTSKFSNQGLSYQFNDTQKKIDKDVTDAMSKGKEYSEIEEKFVNQLKKK